MQKDNFFDMPCAMTVAGSDSGAGAGIQADLLTFAANGVYACSAIAALTAQNPSGVHSISAPDPNFLTAQMRAIVEFYKPQAGKTGMLFNADIAAATVDFFGKHPEIKLVVDPVAISTSGSKLLKDEAVEILKTALIPMATIFTPNLDEAAMLLDIDKIVDMESSAKALYNKYGTPVLLKGGHLESDHIIDALCDCTGYIPMYSQRISGVNTHGSGCTLSAAIAANLAKGIDLPTSCQNARQYLLASMANPLKIGGENFINHFPNFQNERRIRLI